MGRLSKTDELLREQIVDFLERIGVDVSMRKNSTDNIQISCPFASVGGHSSEIDHHPSFGIQISERGIKFNCFTCHKKGNGLIRLVEMLQEDNLISSEMSAYEIHNSIKVEFPDFYEESEGEKKKTKVIPLHEYSVKHPDFLTYNIRKRKLDKEIIELFKLRYKKETSQVVFPCYDKNMGLQGIVTHYTNGKKPKYKNEFDAGKSLYGEWLIERDILIIVEGMYDTITTYKNLRDLGLLKTFSVVGMYGAEVTYEQCNKLIANSRALVLMGDNDMAGIKMENDIFRMCGKKIPLIYKAPYIGHDPDQLTKELFRKALEEKTLFGVRMQAPMKY